MSIRAIIVGAVATAFILAACGSDEPGQYETCVELMAGTLPLIERHDELVEALVEYAEQSGDRPFSDTPRDEIEVLKEAAVFAQELATTIKETISDHAHLGCPGTEESLSRWRVMVGFHEALITEYDKLLDE